MKIRKFKLSEIETLMPKFQRVEHLIVMPETKGGEARKAFRLRVPSDSGRCGPIISSALVKRWARLVKEYESRSPEKRVSQLERTVASIRRQLAAQQRGKTAKSRGKVKSRAQG